MVTQVNPRLPEAEKFSRWWWTTGKHLRLWRTHKRLCPESHWRLYSVLSFAVGILFMILIMLSIHVSKAPM